MDRRILAVFLVLLSLEIIPSVQSLRGAEWDREDNDKDSERDLQYTKGRGGGTISTYQTVATAATTATSTSSTTETAASSSKTTTVTFGSRPFTNLFNDKSTYNRHWRGKGMSSKSKKSNDSKKSWGKKSGGGKGAGGRGKKGSSGKKGGKGYPPRHPTPSPYTHLPTISASPSAGGANIDKRKEDCDGCSETGEVAAGTVTNFLGGTFRKRPVWP